MKVRNGGVKLNTIIVAFFIICLTTFIDMATGNETARHHRPRPVRGIGDILSLFFSDDAAPSHQLSGRTKTDRRVANSAADSSDASGGGTVIKAGVTFAVKRSKTKTKAGGHQIKQQHRHHHQMAHYGKSQSTLATDQQETVQSKPKSVLKLSLPFFTLAFETTNDSPSQQPITKTARAQVQTSHISQAQQSSYANSQLQSGAASSLSPTVVSQNQNQNLPLQQNNNNQIHSQFQNGAGFSLSTNNNMNQNYNLPSQTNQIQSSQTFNGPSSSFSQPLNGQNYNNHQQQQQQSNNNQLPNNGAKFSQQLVQQNGVQNYNNGGFPQNGPPTNQNPPSNFNNFGSSLAYQQNQGGGNNIYGKGNPTNQNSIQGNTQNGYKNGVNFDNQKSELLIAVTMRPPPPPAEYSTTESIGADGFGFDRHNGGAGGGAGGVAGNIFGKLTSFFQGLIPSGNNRGGNGGGGSNSYTDSYLSDSYMNHPIEHGGLSGGRSL